MSDRFAPEGKMWKCCACGKESEYDQYGLEGKVSSGWDESCILNSILIDKPDKTKIYDGHGLVSKSLGKQHTG